MIRLNRFVATLSVAAVLAAPLAAFAQPAAPAVPSPGAAAPTHKHHRSPYMAALRSLDLTDAQRTQISDTMKAARAAGKTADPATRRANFEKTRAQIDAILTPAQRTQLQAALKNAPAESPDRKVPTAR
jgi:Spy/CpxP family protein refolding chaperone